MNQENNCGSVWNYRTEENGVTVRDIVINTEKGGEPIEILQLSDIHFNCFDQYDFEEANPSLMSTYEYRKWLAGAASVPKVVKCLEHAKTADMVVLTGDVLDFISHGNIALAKEYFFEPFVGRVMACLGNHEISRRVQGKIADPTTLESRLEIVSAIWCNDIYYSSRVLGDKVMLIQMDNASQYDEKGLSFWDCQIEPLSRDIAMARENGYAVLLFFHCNLSTGDPKDSSVRADMLGAKNNEYCNFYDYYAKSDSEGASGTIYNIIVNSGDVIKGGFCGHHHGDFYTEILAKTPDGVDTVIPQYSMIGSIYGEGHILKITVK